MIGDGLQALEDKLKLRQGQVPGEFEVRGFDFITILAAILAAIMPMLQNCFARSAVTVRRVRASANDIPAISQLALLIRQQPGCRFMTLRDACKVARAVTALASEEESSDEDVQKLIDDCCARNWYV